MLRSPFIILLLLLNQQANGFVPAPRRKNIPSLLSESKSILDNILDKAASNNESTDKLLMDPLADMTTNADDAPSSWSYAEFAQTYPNVNNIGIATIKTASADLLAQVAIAHTPVSDIDWERAFLFCAFGAVYLGAFQYWYQVNIFKKVFDVDKFTSQSWGDKLKDTEGLKSLFAQTALDLTVLTFIYLPTFYVFKAGVFSGSADPSVRLSSGLDSYTTNFSKDEFDLVRVWAPADMICFSVPLYLRLPVRHVVSFVWTAYLSFARGGH
ncbi:Mpv17/PMP22 family protein [Skeletonema marinoi]|uniref:Mpv17/PMP22 family protein n=1 Tax=Skeletonema marinoi TaxID=267567 RepID=A0AAD9DEB3_9STRA|nr:Mpv17/PMP22 family protein [Skeletonema marinoi]